MRVGIGFDSHRFTDGDHVMIGGVRVPHTQGVLAHSDGDVVLHALVDAVLGALALGDIGQHFPDTDPRFANASSSDFVMHLLPLLQAHQYHVNNIDATVVCEAPKLKTHIIAMREHIANLLDVPVTRVSVKATTNESMGFIGRQEGLAAMVVTTLVSV